MKNKIKRYAVVAMAFLTLSILVSLLPIASGVGAITLTPTSSPAGGVITVAGTGFAASQAVGIVIGTEITVTNETHTIPSPAGTGPFTAYTNHSAIKPGSFYYHCVVSSDTNAVESDYYDRGDGTLSSSSEYALNPFVNYVTGAFGRSTSSAWDGFTVVYTASYTYYQYNATPAAGVTTTSSGSFSAPITVPATLTNSTYTVTAIDVKGNKGVSTLTVGGVIPEGLSMGIILALTAAVIVGTRFLRKKPKISILTPSKTI